MTSPQRFCAKNNNNKRQVHNGGKQDLKGDAYAYQNIRNPIEIPLCTDMQTLEFVAV